MPGGLLVLSRHRAGGSVGAAGPAGPATSNGAYTTRLDRRTLTFLMLLIGFDLGSSR